MFKYFMHLRQARYWRISAIIFIKADTSNLLEITYVIGINKIDQEKRHAFINSTDGGSAARQTPYERQWPALLLSMYWALGRPFLPFWKKGLQV